MRRIAIILAAGLMAAHCSGGNVRADAKFSYENIYQDRYKRGNGGIIPITIERGESYSGTITRDQRYLYFSSNNSGNYDIYLRDLNDVFSVPVVQTVTNQKEPSVSPDGKHIVYVDDELDPDGDIILLKVNPQKLIDLYRDRKEPDEGWFASRAKNLTNSEKNRLRARDVNPTWSPDGNWIAYSSDLDPQKADELGAGAGAIQNIWLMPMDDPEKKRRLTTKGGVMPSFSHDGKKIVYISYEDPASQGAVYEIEIESGKTRRLTSGKQFDFYPTYAPADDGIILTRIAADTNGDGQIDRKDAGQIIRIYPEDEAPVDDDDYVPLSSQSDHVFDTRVSNFIGGSVVFAQLKGDDINVAFIPISGAVPIKPDIRQQQAYLEGFRKPGKTTGRYCMGLQQLPSAFHKSADLAVYEALSYMRRARCDKKQADEFRQFLQNTDADELALYRLFNDLSAISPDYADLKGLAELEPLAADTDPGKFFDEILREKKIWKYYREELEPKEYLAILSFIRHEQTLFLIRAGKIKEARDTLRKVLRENPAYLASDELLYEIGRSDSGQLPAPELIFLSHDAPDAGDLKAYFSGDKPVVVPVRPHIRRQSQKFLLAYFEGQFTAEHEETVLEYLRAYPEKKYTTLNALYHLAEARDHAHEELYAESDVSAAKVKALSKPGSVYNFYADIVRGSNAEIKVGRDASMAIYSEAIRNYQDEEQPENVKQIVDKIGTYYKERADQQRAGGNDRAAALEYEALLDLYLSAHANKLTRELSSGDLLDFALNLDQVALRARGGDDELLTDILKFYDARIDLARRYLVTEFIFGRGFLRAQLGISRHIAAEADGLSKSEKKQVFEDFRKAEIDLNWCFFANAKFADAYVMLGWMYQFIDEKREVVLEASSGKRDREVFESLYKTYFPDYLFEKNIRLYQKTLALFGTSGSPRVRNSFHLNIANNYFLLNNYSQAEEHYTAILDKKGNPDYQFESPEQEFMFYYHLGRTLYFTGKNDAAARYLEYVENNLNSRYPLQGLPAEKLKINQARRETAYKTFALNSEYSQNLPKAVSYNQAIVGERQLVGAESPVSMVFLELARLNLRQADFNSALDYTNKAEEALAKEEKIPIPKFKIRIKWFWVYEPWTWLVGLIYKLPYDDVYIGDNHLAFELPTVNRYQLLYSIRAEIFKSKGLLHDASGALAKLVEQAEKDDTKHGKETLSSAVSRRAELEFNLKNWDESLKLYQDALKRAEKSGNTGSALTFRKNIELCRLRKLETLNEGLGDKLKAARKNFEIVADYEKEIIDERTDKAIDALKKQRKTDEKPEPTKEEIDKVKDQINKQVKAELQPLLFFKGLNLAHEAELSDFSEQLQAKPESFDQFMAHKRAAFDRHAGALKFFRGYTKEAFSEIYPEFEPDLKNNSLRLKLAMNRAKVMQEMNLFDESIAEFKEIQEKSQEFRANLEYAISTYRTYRVYEDAETEDKVNIAPYRALVGYFMQNQSFLRANTDLFERLCNILTDRALRTGNYADALRFEDLKRQSTGLQMYFDDLKLYGAKDEVFQKLLITEQRRAGIDFRIRAARLNKTPQPQLEKELADADREALALRQRLAQPDRLDYRYETFFTEGYSEAEVTRLAGRGILYVMRPRDETVVVLAKTEVQKKGKTLRYESFKLDPAKDPGSELADIAQKTGADLVILNSQVFTPALTNEKLRRLSLQTSLRAALNFVNNPDRARRNVLQIVKSTSFFSFGGSNDINYGTPQPMDKVRNGSEVAGIPQHRNVVDYEGELGRKSVLVDNAFLTPAALFNLRANPNYAIVSRTSRDKLQAADDFRFAGATDLYFSAMGAGQVLHTFNGRGSAKAAIAGFLTEGTSQLGTLLTGNAALSLSRDNPLAAEAVAAQKVSYAKKIAVARKLGEYKEAASYAEDALSLFPQDFDFHASAAELYYKQGDATQGASHFKAAIPDGTLARKKMLARLFLRASDIEGFRTFLAGNPDLKADLTRNGTEFEGLMQLAAFNRGEISTLAEPMAWEDVQKNKKPAKRKDLLRLLSRDLKDDELRGEICNSAIGALEYRLVVDSCLAVPAPRPVERTERERVRDLLFAEKPGALKATDGEDLEFIRSMALLKSGFAADALISAKKFLLALRLNNSENLLTLVFLHVLAERKANTADSRAIARLLSDYGREARKKARNKQTASYYHLLELTAETFEKGEGVLSAYAGIEATSGTVSAENNMRMLGISVLPAAATISSVQTSGFPRDKALEADLKFFAETAAGYGEDVDCAAHNCAPVIKRHLARGENEAALFLMLHRQKSIASRKDVAALPAGAFGYGEVFNDEIYEWFFDGQRARFDKIPVFDEKTAGRVKSGERYLLHADEHNLFSRIKLTPPREVVLIEGPVVSADDQKPSVHVTISAADQSALHSALLATWGKGKKVADTTGIHVKAPYAASAGESRDRSLYIYTDRLPLDTVRRLKPHGYHLFCESRESYNGFVNFAQKVAENMIQGKMPVEVAYESAFKSLKGKQATTRPLYYLYRN